MQCLQLQSPLRLQVQLLRLLFLLLQTPLAVPVLLMALHQRVSVVTPVEPVKLVNRSAGGQRASDVLAPVFLQCYPYLQLRQLNDGVTLNELRGAQLGPPATKHTAGDFPFWPPPAHTPEAACQTCQGSNAHIAMQFLLPPTPLQWHQAL
jgi:hypothetical protein